MTLHDYLVRGGQVVSAQGMVTADVAIDDGVFANIAPDIDPGHARHVVDATDQFVLPGIIDAHNHPYFADSIGPFSLAAAHGGVTTLIPFAGQHFNRGHDPLGIVDSVEAFIAQGQTSSFLDFGAHAILSGQEDLSSQVGPLLELGVTSYKVFMAFPGRRMVDDGQILAIMQAVASTGGLVMVHCENGHAIEFLQRQLESKGDTTASAYPRSRPAALEAEAVFRATALARVADADCYIVHASCAESLELVRLARGQTERAVFLETCPHYLLLTRDDQVRLGPLAKISPPMREPTDVEALWQGVRSGEVDVIATDASGQTQQQKFEAGGDIFAAPFGIPGVETFVPLVTTAATRRGIGLEALVDLMCERPARIFGIDHRKGRIARGLDADLVLLQPSEDVIHGQKRYGSTDYSLYEGWEVSFRPTFSMQRGHPVLEDGRVVREPGSAEFLRANER